MTCGPNVSGDSCTGAVQPSNVDNRPLQVASQVEISSTASSGRPDGTSSTVYSTAPATFAFPLLDGHGKFQKNSPADSTPLEKAIQLYRELYQILKDKVPKGHMKNFNWSPDYVVQGFVEQLEHRDESIMDVSGHVHVPADVLTRLVSDLGQSYDPDEYDAEDEAYIAECLRETVKMEGYYQKEVWPAMQACLDRAVSTDLSITFVIHNVDIFNRDSCAVAE